ncbi:hypothetical protein H072_9896 [Dactylellina haptotyla CBS 200.50]|uniref:Uncharacterized protein n=1 Tax=Dactylellina haptotyla (strain CBS 200.50) TaxID=1284197 RepID=S8BN10_DACHA|nr:hypothetical protein H072_9896 [Dactylellina haptotyla CBS 200.50]
MERQKGERCGIDNCRSRFYHLEDGQWTCSNGHVQEGRLDIREDDEYQPRKGDRRIVEREESQPAEEKFFTGRKGFTLFLQAFQLILRKQVEWLIQDRHFPAEFQLLVRDLWTLRLEAIFSDRSSRAPSSSGYTSRASQSGAESEASASQGNISERETTASQGSGMSIYQSQASSRSRSRSRSASRGRRASRRSKEPTPKLIDTLGMLFIACMLLRLPIEITMLHQWVAQQDIIYFRAITHLPEDMLAKMEVKWKRKFEPKVLPTAEVVRKAVYLSIRYYHAKFGIIVPRIAAELLVTNWVLDFGCPPEVYPAIFNLAKLIDLPLQYDASASQLNLVDCPDLQIMALLVISLKLCYGLDDDDPGVGKGKGKEGPVVRQAWNEWDIANIKPNWKLWKEIIQMKSTDVQSRNTDGGEKRERNWQLGVDEGDIYGWTGREMDEYMDWFEGNFGKNGEGKPSATIAKLFEDDEEQGKGKGVEGTDVELDLKGKLLEKRIEIFKKMQETAELGTAVSEDQVKSHGVKVVRPGDRYRRYKKWEDIKGQKLKTIYLAAAERMAVSVEGFAFVVQKLEYRLWQVVKGKGKKGKGKMESDPFDAEDVNDGEHESDADADADAEELEEDEEAEEYEPEIPIELQ